MNAFFQATLLFTSLLLPQQTPGTSQSVQSLSLELNSAAEAGEPLSGLLSPRWESASIPDKRTLLQASARALSYTEAHSKLVKKALLHHSTLLQRDAAELCRFLSLDSVPTETLNALIKNTKEETVLSTACRSAWSLGLYGATDFSHPDQKSLQVLTDMLKEKNPPLHGAAYLLQSQPSLRTDYLNSILGKRLPKTEFPFLVEIRTHSWAPLNRFLFQALLLDQGLVQENAKQWTASWWQFLAPLSSLEAAHQTLWGALNRHAWALTSQALNLGQNRNISAEGKRFLIHKAPASIANPTLFHWARDTQLDSSFRAQCILKLLRSEGNLWGPKLLPLLKENHDAPILNALSLGMVPWVTQEVLDEFRERISYIPPQAAAYAALILCRHGSHEERMRFLPRLPSLQSNAVAALVAEAAWEVDPSDDIFQIFKEYTKGSGPKAQNLARRILSTILSPKQIAELYRTRLEEEEFPHIRDHLLDNLVFLGTEDALEVFLGWLQQPDALAHPKLVEWAGLLIPEEQAKPLFQTWWKVKDSLPLSLQDITAAALLESDQSTRRHLYQRFSDLSPNFQVVVVTQLAKAPHSLDYETWAKWLRKPDSNRGLSRILAKSLAEALPQSQETCLLLLKDLENQRLPATASGFLVTQLLSHDSGVLREECLRITKALESQETRTDLKQARLRGLSANPMVKDLSSLTEELIAQLQIADPTPLPDSSSFSFGLVRSTETTFLLLYEALRQHGTWADSALLPALQSLAGKKWMHPDRLWLLANHPTALPQTSALALRFLSKTESPFSQRVANESPNLVPSPLYWTNPSLVLDKIQNQLLLPSGGIPLESLINRAIFRWKEDRRFYNYRGWALLANQKYPEAILAFEDAIQRSGLLRVALREPRIGIAVCQQLLAPDQNSLGEYLKEDPESAPLLAARLSVSRNPKLAPILEEHTP
ncbi:MAG TPA: hypothetical protein QGG59_10320 [Planctomycetota bacterium]|jgi:hypothetical protein|nr:hypothetical protein [Planctomycetota bacterium]HJM40496.1 hypothetical protein [Planctomycetota bacterium]|tara:strand:- start:821 stop:3640 length:2820 start_codon:yes stop_codon:yes gene_type:complete